MKNPRRSEKTGPSFNLALEHFRSRWHEESGVSTNLPELGVSKAVLDDTVDEAQSDGVVFHFGVVQVVQQECRTFFDDDCVISSVKWSGCLKRYLSFKLRGREQVAPHEHELKEYLLKLVGVSIDYLVFLESF